MSKINIKSILHNKTENKFFQNEMRGIKQNSSIKFIDDNVKVLLDILEDEINLSRRSKEYTIDMVFKENIRTKGLYMYKGLGTLNLYVDTKKIIIKDNYIEIEYDMIIENNDKQEFFYRIEMEEIK